MPSPSNPNKWKILRWLLQGAHEWEATQEFSNVILGGAQYVGATKTEGADYNPTALTSDYIIAVNVLGTGGRDVTLSYEDVSSGATNPRLMWVIDTTGEVSDEKPITIYTKRGSINGDDSLGVTTPYGSVLLMLDGSNVFVMATYTSRMDVTITGSDIDVPTYDQYVESLLCKVVKQNEVIIKHLADQTGEDYYWEDEECL